MYAASPLRSITGTRINPEARYWYDRRGLCTAVDSPVRTGAHPDLVAWIGNVAGFDSRLRMTQPAIEEWPMSRLIPRVHVYKSFPHFELMPGTYSIDYVSLTKARDRLPGQEWVEDIRGMFPEGSTLLLNFIGNNAQTHYIWSLGPEFWAAPFLRNFDGIVSPEFSTFIDDPKPQFLIGERQKQIFCQEGAEAGFTTIPSIAWSSESSLRRQLDLVMSLYPRVNTVWLDCLGAGVDPTAWTWSRIEMLEKHIPPDFPMRWLVAGAVSGWAIVELHRIFPQGNFHSVNIRPFAATMGKAGTRGERVARFQTHCRRIEGWLRREDLPPAQPRPESLPGMRTIL
ncbi:DUF4417 domain-containing protein [Miltoncostaea oceani]|uniref:DUF4417 domain-containing protein n=1 Tax=Miltoncostaea oceani TaxID=2843216 RepID=UPI001C3C635D|nr:DUF4417 domain-containing protein [Miltoncostaea oceani]